MSFGKVVMNFIYAVYYGFKKGVVPYQRSNEYIKNNKKPLLYSKSYYESLEDQNGEEICYFLENNPIEIYDNGVISGRHRVCAMIGRILSGENYIEFSYYEHKSN